MLTLQHRYWLPTHRRKGKVGVTGGRSDERLLLRTLVYQCYTKYGLYTVLKSGSKALSTFDCKLEPKCYLRKKLIMELGKREGSIVLNQISNPDPQSEGPCNISFSLCSLISEADREFRITDCLLHARFPILSLKIKSWSADIQPSSNYIIRMWETSHLGRS